MQDKHNLDNIALPKHKYYFYIGENPSSPQLCDEDYIVIAQVLPLDDLHNHAHHLHALTTEQKQQVVIMICAGIRDICTTNLQFTPDGKVAFIDTEQANSNPSEIFFEKNRKARVRSISKSLEQFNALLGEDFITEDQLVNTINRYLQE